MATAAEATTITVAVVVLEVAVKLNESTPMDVNGAVVTAVLFTCLLCKYNRFLMLTISG